MNKIIIGLILILVVFSACEEKKLGPISESMGKPSKVTQVEATPIPGGVSITYRIPDEEDLLAVKGVFTLTNGKTKETVASFYENNMTIQGYNDVEEHVVELYSVNRAGELSDPQVVKFIPLESAINKAFASMEIVQDFGGASFSWVNPDKEALNFEFVAQDTFGVLRPYKILTSQEESSKFSVRGFDPKPMVFGVIISDNWDNVTDTIFPDDKLITPLYERKFDKSKWSLLKMANDVQSWNNWEGISNGLIDDDVSTIGHSLPGVIPASFTIDMGEIVKLSRVVMFQWDDDCEYAWGNPKQFEVYGRIDPPNMSGDWDEWTKIMDCTIVKPSGLPVGQNTDADLAALKAGHEFGVDVNAGLFRYVRIRIMSTWGASTFIHIAEVSLFGADPISE